MCSLRGSLALTALVWWLAVRPGTIVPGIGGGTPALADEEDDEGPPCGQQPDDADQLAAVRAMAAEQCDCASASDHDEYVSCVDEVADAAVEAGLLRDACEEVVERCAERSTCGRPGFVTCCLTNDEGETKCRIKREGKCLPPKGSSACVGSAS